MKRSVCPALVYAALVFLTLAPGASALDPTRDRILYGVGYGHLDDQWNWTIQDTINAFIPDSLHQNFLFFTNANYTNYTFSFEGALRYQFIKEYYPADFLTLSNYVQQGRWHVAGSMITPSDVNIPSPEALMRHLLYANAYWGKTFGRTPVDLLLPDAFGFGYALPSLAAHCELKGFSSMRAGPGAAVTLPFQNIGRWLGPDGQGIVAVIDPGAYSQPVTDNLANDSYHYNRINTTFAESGLYLDYMYFGNAGDQGGGPSDSTVSNVCLSVRTTNGLVHVLSAASDQMYRDLSPAQVSQLRGYQGEMIAQTLGTGGYTSHGELKRWNRQCEQQAMAAEGAAVLSDWLQGGGTYPQDRFNTAWQRFLWHDMYDDITGVSIPAAYHFTWNDYLLSLNDFASEETRAVGMLASAMDTRVLGVPLVVYNALTTPRQDLVEAKVDFAEGLPAAVRVFDSGGNEVPSQVGVPNGITLPVTFLASVPSLGAAVYDVRPAASPSSLNTGLSITTNQVQNGRYLVQLNSNGDVVSIFDKLNARQLLGGAIRWDFLYDLSTNLPSWEIQYDNASAAPAGYLTGPASFQILESGPARVSLAVTRHYAGSSFTERIRLGAGGAGDRVEWDVSVRWNTAKTLLKFEFPLAVTNSRATFDLGLGTVQRGNNTPRLYEGPAQQWADMSTSNAASGITLMTDCKYGWDKPNDNTLRLTIFHTPEVRGSFPYQAGDSFGTHRMLVGLASHNRDWRGAGSPWVPARLNQPLQAFQVRAHAPMAPAYSNAFSFLSSGNSNVMVKALKKAENSDAIIVRLQELTGQAQTAELGFIAPILAAKQMSGLENPIADLYPSNGVLTVSLGAFAPMTVALTLGSPRALLPGPLSAPVTLPFDLDVMSTDANRKDGNFDSGYTYPAELMPVTLERGGIHFQMGPTNNGAANALSCRGQTIVLNAGAYDHLYLLAASASNTTTGTFYVQGQPTRLTVPYFTGFIGQWSPPYFLTNQEVAWVCTHRHDGAGNNNSYDFCYLYRYAIALPANTTSIVLPNAPNIRIFAMSLGVNASPEADVAGGVLGENQLPWADAGPDRTVNADPGTGLAQVGLDGSRSADPDGFISSYRWTLEGSLVATGMSAVVNLPVGTNQLLLTVIDNQGAAAVAVVSILVLPPLSVSLSAAPTNSLAAPLTVQFTGQATGGVVTTGDLTDDHLGTVTAQGENNGINGFWEVATNAFDDVLSSKWLDFANNNPSTRASWIQYQFGGGAQRFVSGYTLSSANDAPERDPANWALLASNDGGVHWDTLDSQINQVFDNRFQTVAYSIASPGAYNIYRLRIDRVANPATAIAVQLAELELQAPPPYTYYWSFGDGTTATASGYGPVTAQHTYSKNGTYTVVLAAVLGSYTGTNVVRITVGPPLMATLSAAPSNGPAPLTIQFNAAAFGGRTNSTPIDTTDDHLGTISAQGENDGLNGNSEIAANAFDNVNGSKWLDFAFDFPSTRQSWIQYQYANDVRYIVARYTVTSANDATIYPERNPANWRLLASNDGGVSWIPIDTRTNQTFTGNFQKLSFLTTNNAPYQMYRFQIDSVANPSQAVAMQLDELEFIATPPTCSYWWSFGDGTSSLLQNPQHRFGSNGIYQVVLTVSDGLSTAKTNASIYVMVPSLAVTETTPSLMLIWPGWAGNYNLYSATNLHAPVAWSRVPAPVLVSNGNFVVTLPSASVGQQFFRLANP